LFGSYAKGHPNESSDVDLVIEFERPIGFRFFELLDYLEALLGQKVDVLTPAEIQISAFSEWPRTLPKVSCMSKRADPEFLSESREALQRIAAYVQDMTYEAFVQDMKTPRCRHPQFRDRGRSRYEPLRRTACRISNPSLEEYGGRAGSIDPSLLRCQSGYCLTNRDQ